MELKRDVNVTDIPDEKKLNVSLIKSESYSVKNKNEEEIIMAENKSETRSIHSKKLNNDNSISDIRSV